MSAFLIETRLKGMKNISKEIRLSYIKKNFDNSIVDLSHFKAIYGTNGAGKSSIVHAYDFYKYLVWNDFPLKDPFSTANYAKLINKKTGVFFIENTFAFIIEQRIYRYKHSITIAIDKAGNLSFDHEKLCVLNERLNITSVFFEVSKGELLVAPKLGEDTFNADRMTLLQNSLANLITKSVKDARSFNAFRPAVFAYLFTGMLVTSFGSKDDTHETVVINDFKGSYDTIVRSLTTNGLKLLKKSFSTIKGENYAWIINESEEEEYKEITKKFAIFLRKLNTNIRDVKVKFKHDGSSLSFCELKFLYHGYDVDYEFESTGIKKLCSLFLAFYQASKNNIVIIDEVDAGVHDLFIKALIEYFVAYTNCQIIVTTHHIELMESIKDLSKSIDILTDDCQIKTWTKSGDYSPSSLYRKGYLDGTPFNLNPFDFAEVFSEE